ncbi:MAG: DNA mismatch repair protein MutS [Candidatus Gracilibacteria bacterium]|nr:DNA mismatch repair protein MutS [Candidatus Gracilibacteria bacterium]
MQEIKNIIDLIDKAIKDEPNNLITGGNIIKTGFDIEVDEYRNLVEHSQDWLANYQTELIEKTGLNFLKIKFTNVLGYFIELPVSAKSKIPDNFIAKQTLVSALRYTTFELQDFEKKILNAENLLFSKEYEIFKNVREKINNSFLIIKELSNKTANLDMITSLGRVAYNNNYSRPKISKNSKLEIIGGRHPVIEKIEKDFISNDLNLDNKKYINIITGPNMGGKSTYLRQNALIILMAHIGSFVPARDSFIPLVDKIFSRVGASDNLFLGQSTFMVEMQEMANILHNSTENSFIIIDEIGRGTSTYDGMSLAWAILKYLHDEKKAKVLFATHYHELIDESIVLKGVENYSVAVGENNEGIVFLRKIIKGGIKKSYGLEIAKLAGINKEVINESKKMLLKLEKSHTGKQMSLGSFSLPELEIKIIEKESPILEELKQLDINNLSPVEALNKLYEIKNEL